jgi:pilus assembly protein CpaC
MSMRKGFLILVLALTGGGAVLWAQVPALPASAVVVSAPASEVDAGAVRLLVGRSMVLDVGTTITRVSLTSAEVADALVTAPSQLLINGKIPGTISMFVWDKAGALKRYEVIVQRDLARLSEQMRLLFPGEKIDVQSNGKNVVLSGSVTNKDLIEKAVNVAGGYVDKKEEVVTLLQLQAGAPTNQVLLQVRFAEVSRNAMTELGASFFTSPLGIDNTVGRLTTQQFAAPGFDNLTTTKDSTKFGSPVTGATGSFTFSDMLNLFLFNRKYDIGAMVRLLQTRGMFQSLAEPNLVSESGKEASFLAGGEFPIPIAQGSGANIGVSVVFKEFGIRLSFTPTVTGDRVHLKVKPEVSSLDFANAVSLAGFRIPALITRKTETELELQDGQTFAIAGLMSNSVSSTLSKVPGIGDIPILGQLFKSKAAQKNQTELVVMITPHILPNNSSGVTPNLPRTPEPYLPAISDKKSVAPPPPAFSRPRSGADAGSPAAPAQAQAPANRATTMSPAEAAAAVSALTPSGPKTIRPAAPSAPAAAQAVQPAAAQKVAPASSQAVAASSDATRQLTSSEKRAIERARHDELEAGKKAEKTTREEAQAGARAQAIEGRRLADQMVIDQKQAAKDGVEQQRLAREQAKRDAEDAKRAQEAAKKQAEIDRRNHSAVDQAAARLKAAEAAYNAEIAKENKD